MALEYDYEDNTEQHISSEEFLTNEREAARKARQEKRLRKRYKFSDKEHSRLGIISSVLAMYAVLFLIAAIVISTVYRGQGSWLVGLFGVITFICSIIGIVCGLVAFRNTDVLLKYAWIGLIANVILFLLMGLLMVMGL